MAFFVLFGLQVAYFALLTIGLLDGAGGGILGLISAITTGRFLAAIFCGLTTAVVAFTTLGGAYLLQSVARYYWNRGDHAKDAAQVAAANPGLVQYALNSLSK